MTKPNLYGNLDFEYRCQEGDWTSAWWPGRLDEAGRAFVPWNTIEIRYWSPLPNAVDGETPESANEQPTVTD